MATATNFAEGFMDSVLRRSTKVEALTVLCSPFIVISLFILAPYAACGVLFLGFLNRSIPKGSISFGKSPVSINRLIVLAVIGASKIPLR